MKIDSSFSADGYETVDIKTYLNGNGDVYRGREPLSQTETSAAKESVEEIKSKLARFIAERFVRRDGKFYRLENPSVSISATDLKRVSLHQVNSAFPDVKVTDELWAAVCAHVINDTHTVQGESVPVWDGMSVVI
tara:strand:- start:28 stop:432 length:405 start_codon:yes stop_codon:yes gene_type:complete